MPSIAV